MNKKYVGITIVALVLLLICVKPIVNFVGDLFWEFVAVQLDKEEQLRLQKIENDEIIRGKDTVLIWGNKFEIWNHGNEKRLSIETEGVSENILKKVTDFKVIDEQLYIVSDGGA